ncbi:MAG: putative Ig domain-containing protein [Phycisphaerae bacterium]
MKALYAGIVAVHLCQCALAQPVITSADWWQLGDYYVATANPENVNVPVDGVIKGTGYQEWDFTGIGVQTRNLRYDYVVTSDGGYGQENIFPGADFAERMIDEDAPTAPAWMYISQDAGVGRTIYGTYTPYDSEQPESVFNPPMVDFPDPIQYLQNWNAHTVYLTAMSGFDLQIVYNADSSVNAYGRMKLPNFGWVDCLRVMEEATYEVYWDMGGGSWVLLQTNYIRNYYWLAHGFGIAVHIGSTQETAGMPAEEFAVAGIFQIQYANSNPIETPVITAIDDQTVLEVGVPFSYAVQATGSPAPTFTLPVAPADMTIHEETGLIEWTPTGANAGAHTVTVQADNIAGTDTETFTLYVVNANEPPQNLRTSVFSSSTVALAWDPPAHTNLLAGYAVYHTTDPQGGYTLLADNLPVSPTTFAHDDAPTGIKHYYRVEAILSIPPDEWLSDDSNSVVTYVLTPTETAYGYDDSTAESGLVVGGSNAQKAVSYTLGTTDEVRLTKVAVYLTEVVDASLTVKVYDDDFGYLPGTGLVQLTYPAALLSPGWNILDIQPEFLQPVFTGGGNFFVGIVEGATENPVGVDENISGHSFFKTSGGDWSYLFAGDLMIRALLVGQSQIIPGDVNGDGLVNNFDIAPFVYAVTHDRAEFEDHYPDGCYDCADVNGDGTVNNFDIAPFVSLLTGG